MRFGSQDGRPGRRLLVSVGREIPCGSVVTRHAARPVRAGHPAADRISVCEPHPQDLWPGCEAAYASLKSCLSGCPHVGQQQVRRVLLDEISVRRIGGILGASLHARPAALPRRGGPVELVDGDAPQPPYPIFENHLVVVDGTSQQPVMRPVRGGLEQTSTQAGRAAVLRHDDDRLRPPVKADPIAAGRRIRTVVLGACLEHALPGLVEAGEWRFLVCFPRVNVCHVGASNSVNEVDIEAIGIGDILHSIVGRRAGQATFKL